MGNIIALCGMSGAGKSEASKFIESLNYSLVHLGSTEEAIRRHGFTNEQVEREIRNEMRAIHGMAAMAVLAMDTIKLLLNSNKNVIIDNMYSWSEYKLFQTEFGKSFHTVAIHAAPKLRYARLKNRAVRPLDTATSISRDYSEIEEIEKGGPIAMADFHIVNQSSQTDLVKQIKEVIANIEQQA